MLLLQASIVLALTATVSAAPWGGWGSWGNSAGRPWWTPSQASSYLEFGKRFPGANTNAPTCDMSQAVMPACKQDPKPNLQLFVADPPQSIVTSSRTSSRPITIPRSHRTRNTKLHLRSRKPDRHTRSGRCQSNPLQRQLHRGK